MKLELPADEVTKLVLEKAQEVRSHLTWDEKIGTYRGTAEMLMLHQVLKKKAHQAQRIWSLDVNDPRMITLESQDIGVLFGPVGDLPDSAPTK